jgi:glycosyltransferase involved in cell wall biosynthesis
MNGIEKTRDRSTKAQLDEGIEPIRRPYLLVIHIPAYVDEQGTRWVDPLWHRDLVRHLDYLEYLVLACPHIYTPPPPGSRSLEGCNITYVPLPPERGRFRSVLSALAVWRALWPAIRSADVVQSGVGNCYPWSLSNITFAIASLQKKFRIVVVESSTWRLLPGQNAAFGERCQSALSEWANRACVSTADFSVFTHGEYKQTLLRGDQDRGHVIHASWIDESNVLTAEAASECWRQKRESGKVRFLFAARLSPEKGVRQLLEALRLLPAIGDNACVDIMGSGDLEEECRAFLRTEAASKVHVRVLAPVEYGNPFFAILRNYSAVLVPSLGDEQPRIVYDAFAVAVPVLASATKGLCDCIEDGETGRLFAPGSARDLAEAVQRALAEPDELEAMGMRGLARARTFTHRAMHMQRFKLLRESLGRRFSSV